MSAMYTSLTIERLTRYDKHKVRFFSCAGARLLNAFERGRQDGDH